MLRSCQRGHVTSPPASTFRREGLQLPALEAPSRGSGRPRLHVPSHQPWQRRGGWHSWRRGPACPAEVRHKRDRTTRSTCAPGSPTAGCTHCAAHGGPVNGGCPVAQRGNLFPLRPPGSSRFPPVSLQTAAGPGRVQPHGPPAGQAASSPGTRQPPVPRGRPARGKPAHLGSRCEGVLGARGRPSVPSQDCVRLAVQQPGQLPAFTQNSNIKPRSAF